MSPHELHNLLPLYADGELDAQRAAAVEARIATQPELREQVRRWQALRRCAGRVLTAQGAPAGLHQRIAGALAVERGRATGRRYRLFATFAAAAAFLLLAVRVWPSGSPAISSHAGAGNVVRAGPPSSTVLVSADRFSEVYRRCALHDHHGIALDSDCPIKASEKLARHCAFRVIVPDLSQRGFTLAGVCECFPQREVHAVHAYFKRAAPPAVVSVFSLDRRVRMRDCSGEACRGKRTYEEAVRDGIQVFKWDFGNSSFAVCSELDATTLQALADGVDVALLNAQAPSVAAKPSP